MAVSVDTSPYKPRLPPANPDDLQGLSRWAFGEFQRISAAVAQGNDSLDTLGTSVTSTVFGASGASHSTGLVPDPGATAGKLRWLNETATWVRGVSFNIMSFGGANDGVTDNTTAINNALSALKTLTTSGGKIVFPDGTFVIGSLITFTMPTSNAPFDVTLEGAGPDATVLMWGASAGMQFNYESGTDPRVMQSTHFRDLTFAANRTNGGTALTLVNGGTTNGNYCAMSELARVTFRGADILAGIKYWTNDLVLNGISNVNITGCIFQGPATAAGGGITAQGQNGSAIACCINVCGNTQINQKAIGVTYGDFLQGMSFDQVIWNGCATSINQAALLSGDDSYLVVANSQFGQFATGNAVSLQTALNVLLFTNNLFLLQAANTGGLLCTKIANATFVSNQFEAATTTNTTGISVDASVASTVCVIDDNTFAGMKLGLQIKSGANVGLGQNYYTACTTNMTNASASLGLWENDTPGNFGWKFINNGALAASHGIAMAVGKAAASDSSSVVMSFFSGDSSNNVGSITRSGTGVVFNTTSDRRLKENIKSTASGLAILEQINVRDFNWCADPDRTQVQGVVAQELYEVFPQAVRQGGDDAALEPWTVNYAALVPLLVQSVQELKAKVDQLEHALRQATHDPSVP